jgi:hypothetical protein
VTKVGFPEEVTSILKTSRMNRTLEGGFFFFGFVLFSHSLYIVVCQFFSVYMLLCSGATCSFSDGQESNHCLYPSMRS